MRKYIVLLFLTIFSAALATYFFVNLNPFDVEKVTALATNQGVDTETEFVALINELHQKGVLAEYLNTQNVLIVLSLLLLSITCGVSFIHLLISRLFFTKFYEQPSLSSAVRRALWVSFTAVSLALYRLYNMEWYLGVLTVILVIIVEVLITAATKRQSAKKQESEENQE